MSLSKELAKPGLSESEIEEDYLTVDTPLPGQNFVCLSFISPEKVLTQKQEFYLQQFLKSICPDKDLKEAYSNYLYKNQEQLDEQFDKQNDYRTSTRGVKIRGVFNTMKEAQIRSKVLQRVDDSHHVFVGQVGYWLPWDPCADLIEGQEYKDKELNELMKKYQENRTHKDLQYAEEVQEKKKQVMAENLRKKELLKKQKEEEESKQENSSKKDVVNHEGSDTFTNSKEVVSTDTLQNTLESPDPWMQRHTTAQVTEQTTAQTTTEEEHLDEGVTVTAVEEDTTSSLNC